VPYPRIGRDPGTPAPPGLNEDEQVRVMLDANRKGMRRPQDELTALPADMPPPGGGWKKSGTLPAPGSGKPYTIYTFSHSDAHATTRKAKPQHKHKNHQPGRGPIGGATNQPVNDPHTMAVTQNRPNVPTGIDPESSVQATKNPAATQWLGAVGSAQLTAAEEALREAIEDPQATEEQIRSKAQNAAAAARQVALLGGAEEPRCAEVMQLVARAADRVADMRNDEFEGALQQEERSAGSVSAEKFKTCIRRSLAGEREREMLGGEINPAVLENVVRAISIIGDREADAVQDLIDQDKRAPGSVTDSEFTKAVSDVVGIAREAQMLGISRPKTDSAMASVAQVMRILIRHKADALRKLNEQKNAPGSGVTDQQIQQATEELNKMKQQTRGLGISDF
jgi:hypothetical protein